MKRILYVDEEPQALAAAKSYLEKDAGLFVETAGSAEEGLVKLDAIQFDALVSGHKIPALNSIQFLRELRGKGNNTIFIMFSAHSDVEEAAEALLKGADFFILRRGDGKEDFLELERALEHLMDQKAEEESLKRAGSKYSSLLNRMNDGFAYLTNVFDELGRPQDAEVLEANEAFERLTGCKREDLVGKRVSEMIHSDNDWGKQMLEAIREVGETGADRRIEGFSAATQRWFVISIYAPEPGRIAAVLSDTTETRRLAEDLEHSRQLLKRLFDDFPNPIWRSGKDGGWTYANLAWLKITGASAEDVLGQGWLEDIHPEDRDRCREVYSEAFASRQPFEMEFRLKSENGQVRILDTGRPFYEANGNFLGFIGSCYDITSRKENDDTLQLANKKLKILGSITRHDLLNQLTALSGYIGIVQERVADPSLTNYLAKAMHASNNIKKHLEFGRDYERMGTNRPEWQNVQESFNIGISTVQLGDIKLIANLENVEVYADQMLEKVFHNLLENACRHGGMVKTVVFDHREENEGMIISCEDDGIGIANEKRDKLFSNRYGHGLYLVQEILGITGMTIREVGRPSGGARFEIQVPKSNYRFSKP